jgi:hypothetical protein
MLSVWIPIAALLLAQIAPPHSTHNPKHGGAFFLAAGDTLHVEGVWPQQRLFKFYIYDAASRPLAPERMRQLRGDVEAGGQTVPLIPARDGSVFVARVPPLAIPATIIVRIAWLPGGDQEGFQFQFGGYSDEHALSFDLEPTVIPRTRSAILAALRADVREAESLVARRDAAFAFAPAAHGRDHVLALERFVTDLPPAGRPRAAAAIREVVRISWLMHLAGDDGSDEQVGAAAAQFRAAVEDCVSAFGGAGR